MGGHGVETFRLLRHYGLFEMLFPEAAEAMDELPWAEPLVEAALASTDRRIAEERPVTPAFLFAALLWGPVVLRQAEQRSEEHTSELQSRPHLVCRLLLEKKNNRS